MAASHRVAWPPTVPPRADVEGLVLDAERPPPARTYPFPLDDFQRIATTCIERGESVLVAAHTSAGKTVVAEHAIASSLREGGRVVYSSPIKALSNQKHRELQASFQGDVGLLTGDVTLSEDASCLVMTTEVLRLMLYRGSTVMREVRWVVFDEVHMLGSVDRGWVVEESLMLLPPSVRVVLLSATMPNAFEIAEWLASLRGQPVHVVETSARPTPLRHYVCPRGADGLYLVQDEVGRFDEAQWQSAVGSLPRLKPRVDGNAAIVESGERASEPDSMSAQRRAAEVVRVLLRFDELSMLPAILFCFSRRECELLSKQMSAAVAATADGGAALRLLSDEETAQVEEIFEGAVSVLADEDASLPQVKALLPLLRAGVGLHHSGLLPVLRELVEILFAEGLLKVLFATETLAMGLNLPARTVVFSAAHKFDGRARRLLKPTEYTQMAGRAGRRGLDTQGYSVILLSQWLGADDGEEMLSRRYSPLRSRFSLRFATLLKLLRTEGADSSTLLARNLRTYQLTQANGRSEKRRRAISAELSALAEQAEAERELHAQADSYLQMRAALHRFTIDFERRLREHARPWLQPGRVVRLNGQRGWGVVVSVHGATPVAAVAAAAAAVAAAAGGARGAGALGSGDELVHVLTRDSRKRRQDDADEGAGGAPIEMQVIGVPRDAISQLAAIRLWLPRDLHESDARVSAHCRSELRLLSNARDLN